MTIAFDDHHFLIEEPSLCPHCHCTMIPDREWQGFSSDSDNSSIYITIWACPGPDCSRLIVCEHSLSYDQPVGETFAGIEERGQPFEGSPNVLYLAKIKRFLSGSTKGEDWSSVITNLESGFEKGGKSKFIQIYDQASHSEALGLDEISGMGYRKAIEHLVKDLAVKNFPKEAENIKSKFLGEVINDYFEGNLKGLLERATWLGNDHSHYFKLFEEFDLSKLKKLIRLISAHLEHEVALQEYLAIEGRKTKRA
ncbi:DUF4145 domain-containing protein [Algoriphagus terrigena]|uniref:DUF4145 domain-containing protein n=1 Tax=Algoriphagus terrigena TaxID=344884 RepID=UPI000400CDB9|nr:DUF4145 domain-containing protein [Algoriphagus terrigena]